MLLFSLVLKLPAQNSNEWNLDMSVDSLKLLNVEIRRDAADSKFIKSAYAKFLLARYYKEVEKNDSSRITLVNLIEDASDQPNIQADFLALVHFNLGMIYKNVFGDFLRAKDHFTYSYELSLDTNDLDNASKALTYKAFSEMDFSDYSDALMDLKQVLQLYEKLGDTIRLVHTYNNIGHLFNKLHMDDNAREYLNKSLELLLASSKISRLSLCTVLGSMGELELNTGNLDLAGKYLNRAYRNSINKNDSINSEVWLGSFYTKSRTYDSALYFNYKVFKSMEANEKRQTVNFYQLQSMVGLARTYFLMNQLDSATKYAQMAERKYILSKITDVVIRADLLDLLASVAEANNDYKETSIYLKELNSVNKLLLSDQQQLDIQRQQYESKLKINNLENEALQERLEKEQAITYFSIIGAFVFLFMSILIFRQYSISRKALIALKVQHQKVEDKNIEIEKYALDLASANDEIRAINENLEDIVKQRTAEIELKNDTLEHYAFMNSHELRAPISRLLGLLNLLEHETEENERNHLTDLISVEVTALDKIVRNINRAIEKGTPLERLDLKNESGVIEE